MLLTFWPQVGRTPLFEPLHERAKANGWKTRTVNCKHDVMLDLPGELTNLLLELATSEAPKQFYEEDAHVAQ